MNRKKRRAAGSPDVRGSVRLFSNPSFNDASTKDRDDEFCGRESLLNYERYMKLQGGVGGGGEPLIGMGTSVGDGDEEGGDGELDETLEGGDGDSSVLGPANSRLDCPPAVTLRLLPVVAL